MSTKLNSDSLRLAMMAAGGLFSGGRVGISPTHLSISGVGILVSNVGEVNEHTAAVRVVPEPGVPPGCLVIGRELGASLDLQEEAAARWELRMDGFSFVQAQEICLEIAIETQLQEALQDVAESNDLVGALLWQESAKDAEGTQLHLAGKPYKVTELLPAVATAAVYEITPQTRVQVFSPGVKSGVDIVLLADCSGSMGTDDLTLHPEAAASTGFFSRVFGQTQTLGRSRIDFLREQLLRLLERRLQVSGRVSRISLMSFTTDSKFCFPRTGGMVEVDDSVSDQLVEELRSAVALLRAENAGTDIGQALNSAAELLHQHGHPGNERLIVLVSDGADCPPAGEDRTGEFIEELEDPVHLMDRLHRQMNIRLHAIGISNVALYEQWCRRKGQQPAPGFRPNHELLNQLIRVAGGDPSHQGDVDVLEKYFTGLERGVARYAAPLRAAAPAKIQPFEMERLQDLRTQMTVRPQLEDDIVRQEALFSELLSLLQGCNGLARTFGATLFEGGTYEYLLKHHMKRVANMAEFTSFAVNLKIAFKENQAEPLKKTIRQVYEFQEAQKKAKQPLPLPSTASSFLWKAGEMFLEDRFQKVLRLREFVAHELRLEQRQETGQYLEKLIGQRHIRDDDAAQWVKLHLAAMSELISFFKELDQVLRNLRPDSAAVAGAPLSGSGEPKTSVQLKPLIRGWELAP